MGESLGKLLAEAGVKGAKPIAPVPTIAELRALSREEPEPAYTQEAMSRLPKEFQPLFQVKKGQGFVAELRKLLEGYWGDNGDWVKPVDVAITAHVIFGLSQLVHDHWKNSTGSKRRSFDDLIPNFLEMKKFVSKKNPPADLRALILKNL